MNAWQRCCGFPACPQRELPGSWEIWTVSRLSYRGSISGCSMDCRQFRTDTSGNRAECAFCGWRRIRPGVAVLPDIDFLEEANPPHLRQASDLRRDRHLHRLAAPAQVFAAHSVAGLAAPPARSAAAPHRRDSTCASQCPPSRHRRRAPAWARLRCILPDMLSTVKLNYLVLQFTPSEFSTGFALHPGVEHAGS